MIVLAPANVQEAIDMVGLAFDLADTYRTIAMVVADGAIGQMMEPAELPPMQPVRPRAERRPWALTGAVNRPHNVITSLYLGAEELERTNLRLQRKLARIASEEVRFREYEVEDAEYLLVAFGTCGRICRSAVQEARTRGVRVGLLRPVTLWPFPSRRLAQLSAQVKAMLVVEMNAGQMVDDVRLATGGACPVSLLGRVGGVIPLTDDIVPEIETMAGSQRKCER